MPEFIVTTKSIVRHELHIEAANMTDAVRDAINAVRMQDVPRSEMSFFDEVQARLVNPQ